MDSELSSVADESYEHEYSVLCVQERNSYELAAQIVDIGQSPGSPAAAMTGVRNTSLQHPKLQVLFRYCRMCALPRSLRVSLLTHRSAHIDSFLSFRK